MLSKYLLPVEPNLFLTDGGLETTLVFKHGFELPGFAAFQLLNKRENRTLIKQYYVSFIEIAKQYGCGFILEAPTWRANRDMALALGYSNNELAEANQQAVKMMQELRAQYSTPENPMLISGCVGPRFDAYQASSQNNAITACEFHLEQIMTLAKAGVNHITAMTLTDSEEAIGIANAAAQASVRCVISFTVETDGSLPSGEQLGAAIEKTDAASQIAPAYYMINCAHPSHFMQLFTKVPWLSRIAGIRSNASCKSHAELDNSDELDEGDPVELGELHSSIAALLPNLRVLGGCCGTSAIHVQEMVRNLASTSLLGELS